ncbi:MAG: response regulator [Verrucomicrobiae bacterium]|nr:response regulator [Verrucomicrobiae bacterium]
MSFRLPHEDSPLDAPPLADMSAILVVDEDPAFQLGLKTFLREYVGFEKVFIARNGQEALDFIRAEPSIEVVTLDYRMPGMSGIEVLTSLRTQASRPIAVLMITGHPSDELEAEYRAQGTEMLLTTHFLTKPVQFEKLEPVVLAAHEEVITTKRRLREREIAAAAAKDVVESGTTEDETLSPGLAERLDRQLERLDTLEQEVKSQRRKWRADFWKLAFVVLLFWLAGQFGLLKKLKPHWNGVKGSVTQQVEQWMAPKPSPSASSGESANPASPNP